MERRERPKAAGLTVDEIRDLLSYDPNTGELRWLWRTNGIKIGDIAGHAHKSGYRRIGIKHKEYAAHHIVWMHVHGRWPIGEIDHKNGDKSDNRLANLREATRAQNMCNKPLYKNNLSGLKGARLYKGKWEARIRTSGKLIYLGSFNTAQEAHEAYVRAAEQYHGKFARAS